MKLSELNQTKIVKIPGFEGLEITVEKYLKMGMMMDVQKKYPKLAEGDMESKLSAGNEMLVNSIKSWNLTDDNGNVLPIDSETIKELPQDVALFLTREITPEKKN